MGVEPDGGLDRGSGILDRGSGIGDRGSRGADWGSGIGDGSIHGALSASLQNAIGSMKKPENGLTVRRIVAAPLCECCTM